MARSLRAGGITAVLVGAALILPIVADWLERDRLTPLGVGFLAVAASLIACGGAVAVIEFRRRVPDMPSAVRAAVTANALVLAFLALELSDRVIRQDGKLFYWTTFLLPPALLLFGGLLAARPWSWWVARGTAALAVVWFLGFLAWVPIAPLQADGVPIPWYGRVYTAGVTIAFVCIFAVAFRALGQEETRSYFRGVRSGVNEHAEPDAATDGGGM